MDNVSQLSGFLSHVRQKNILPCERILFQPNTSSVWHVTTWLFVWIAWIVVCCYRVENCFNIDDCESFKHIPFLFENGYGMIIILIACIYIVVWITVFYRIFPEDDTSKKNEIYITFRNKQLVSLLSMSLLLSFTLVVIFCCLTVYWTQFNVGILKSFHISFIFEIFLVSLITLFIYVLFNIQHINSRMIRQEWISSIEHQLKQQQKQKQETKQQEQQQQRTGQSNQLSQLTKSHESSSQSPLRQIPQSPQSAPSPQITEVSNKDWKSKSLNFLKTIGLDSVIDLPPNEMNNNDAVAKEYNERREQANKELFWEKLETLRCFFYQGWIFFMARLLLYFSMIFCLIIIIETIYLMSYNGRINKKVQLLIRIIGVFLIGLAIISFYLNIKSTMEIKSFNIALSETIESIITNPQNNDFAIVYAICDADEAATTTTTGRSGSGSGSGGGSGNNDNGVDRRRGTRKSKNRKIVKRRSLLDMSEASRDNNDEDEDEAYHIYRPLTNDDDNGHHDATNTSELSTPRTSFPYKPMRNAKHGTFGDMIGSMADTSNDVDSLGNSIDSDVVDNNTIDLYFDVAGNAGNNDNNDNNASNSSSNSTNSGNNNSNSVTHYGSTKQIKKTSRQDKKIISTRGDESFSTPRYNEISHLISQNNNTKNKHKQKQRNKIKKSKKHNLGLMKRGSNDSKTSTSKKNLAYFRHSSDNYGYNHGRTDMTDIDSRSNHEYTSSHVPLLKHKNTGKSGFGGLIDSIRMWMIVKFFDYEQAKQSSKYNHDLQWLCIIFHITFIVVILFISLIVLSIIRQEFDFDVKYCLILCLFAVMGLFYSWYNYSFNRFQLYLKQKSTNWNEKLRYLVLDILFDTFILKDKSFRGILIFYCIFIVLLPSVIVYSESNGMAIVYTIVLFLCFAMILFVGYIGLKLKQLNGDDSKIEILRLSVINSIKHCRIYCICIIIEQIVVLVACFGIFCLLIGFQIVGNNEFDKQLIIYLIFNNYFWLIPSIFYCNEIATFIEMICKNNDESIKHKPNKYNNNNIYKGKPDCSFFSVTCWHYFLAFCSLQSCIVWIYWLIFDVFNDIVWIAIIQCIFSFASTSNVLSIIWTCIPVTYL